ncbi:hypothetical protein A3K87_05760 [Variovorax paradoxus]|uniref:Uncharacterized protein n=1 Tax=Variovorax paradoxus TaxID=34073 RepID=A0AA91DUA8_VARPD|nr:hypothetical protein [Variovorax paradoxus]OAK66711.1 hypothetical protein A3K87_05760 [Variovorax paradoxus]
MSEFNNRIAAQRDILLKVNQFGWKEELYGLSSGALERWTRVNEVGVTCDLVTLLHEAASKLFFLANKSQEQVTDEYKLRALEVAQLTRQIELALVKDGRSSRSPSQ